MKQFTFLNTKSVLNTKSGKLGTYFILYRTPRFGQAAFQVLSSHTLQVAAVLVAQIQTFSGDCWRRQPLGQKCRERKATFNPFSKELWKEHNLQVQDSFYYPLNNSLVAIEIQKAVNIWEHKQKKNNTHQENYNICSFISTSVSNTLCLFFYSIGL